MVFRNRGPTRNNEHWTFNNFSLEIVDNFNYLGTVFNYTGSFILNQEYLVGKSLKALNVLLFNLKQTPVKISTSLQLFDAFVSSILNYACEIWGFGKSKEVERIHLKFCKSLLCVKQSTSNMGIYGELKRYPLFINRQVRIIKYWCNIVNSKNVIVNHLYSSMLNDINRGKTNWLSNVKVLLDNVGLSYVWNDPNIFNLKNLHVLFKQTLIDQFIQSWHHSISISPVLSTYMLFKRSFDYSLYLDKTPKKFRIAFAKLRLSSHQLRIETGRYGNQRIERNQRYCLICNILDIEDEFHFVCVCNAYNVIRKQYLRNYYYNRPSVYKFVELMQNSNHKTQLKLCKFVYEAFIIRQGIINTLT